MTVTLRLTGEPDELARIPDAIGSVLDVGHRWPHLPATWRLRRPLPRRGPVAHGNQPRPPRRGDPTTRTDQQPHDQRTD